MADNTVLPQGTEDGDTYASDDISGIKFQRVKVTLGSDGVNSGDISGSNPIPISGSIGNTTFASTQSGTWTVALGSTQRTCASNIASTDGSVTAGKQSAQFVPSSDFTGTLLGAAWPGTNNPIGFSVSGNDTLGAITYTVASGSITILTIT